MDRLDNYTSFRLEADLGSLTEKQRQILPLLTGAADIMDGLFWRHSPKNPQPLQPRSGDRSCDTRHMVNTFSFPNNLVSFVRGRVARGLRGLPAGAVVPPEGTTARPDFRAHGSAPIRAPRTTPDTLHPRPPPAPPALPPTLQGAPQRMLLTDGENPLDRYGAASIGMAQRRPRKVLETGAAVLLISLDPFVSDAALNPLAAAQRRHRVVLFQIIVDEPFSLRHVACGFPRHKTVFHSMFPLGICSPGARSVPEYSPGWSRNGGTLGGTPTPTSPERAAGISRLTLRPVDTHFHGGIMKPRIHGNGLYPFFA